MNFNAQLPLIFIWTQKLKTKLHVVTRWPSYLFEKKTLKWWTFILCSGCALWRKSVIFSERPQSGKGQCWDPSPVLDIPELSLSLFMDTGVTVLTGVYSGQKDIQSIQNSQVRNLSSAFSSCLLSFRRFWTCLLMRQGGTQCLGVSVKKAIYDEAQNSSVWPQNHVCPMLLIPLTSDESERWKEMMVGQEAQGC